MSVALNSSEEYPIIENLDEFLKASQAISKEFEELKSKFGENIPGCELGIFLDKLAKFNARKDFTLTEFLHAHDKVTRCVKTIEKFNENLPYFKLTYFLYGTLFGAFLYWLALQNV